MSSEPSLPAPHESSVEPNDSAEKVSKLLSAIKGKDWRPISLGDTPSRDLEHLRDQITDILQSQNLVVLAGLGTTLHLNGDKKIAPSMSDLWALAEKLPAFESIVGAVNYPVDDGVPSKKDIELLLSHCQIAQVLTKNGDVKNFIEATEKMIVEQCSFVSPELHLPTHEHFLRKVGRRSTRLPRMKLFTTNYDLAFETAASRTGFIVVDGFSHTQPQGFDGSHFDYDFVRRAPNREAPDYIPNVFHLYKVHGSVDWELNEDKQRIYRVAQPKRPHLIYPRHSKFESSYDQPFLEMMSRLQMALRLPNTGLLIVGFGFNDYHITQPIVAAIEANVSLKCMVVSPGLEARSTAHEAISKLGKLIKGGDLRISLLATGFEDFVSVIPDLVPSTEEERHRSRLREATVKQ